MAGNEVKNIVCWIEQDKCFAEPPLVYVRPWHKTLAGLALEIQALLFDLNGYLLR
jgi:hypothetical protein